tara:strand:- start:27 stop:707 length:681 start_codon:yes stop_codon:yes gene_type:complete
MSCAHIPKSPKRIIPLEAFVEVSTVVKGPKCVDGKCETGVFRYTSSGSIIDVSEDGSYVLGVWHVCRDADLIGKKKDGIETIVKFGARTVDGVKHTAKVIKTSKKHDLCLMFVPGLKRFRPLTIRKHPPAYGEKVFNIASPAGIATATGVPLLHGHYSGFMWGNDMYTIPSMGGSSGSPIIDTRGRLVGVLHSYDRRFSIVSYSATHRAILEFLSDLEEIKNGKNR